MSGPTGADRAAVRHLAGCAGWFVLHTFHHHGPARAAEAMANVGGAGRGGDGVFRRWETEAGGRWLVYREGSMDAPPRRFALREVLDWATQQLDTAEWARVDELVRQRNAATLDADPVDFWRSRAQRTDAENARIDQGQHRRTAAERELRGIVDRALAAPDRSGEQLDLFADQS